jgi:predicted pyridoxine 5'-phosphate oxidase superfamily flavin-nucleotide-binding protein
MSGSAAEHELQQRIGTSERAERFYETQVLDHLNPLMREFVARQEMMFVATSDDTGEADCTFRAGPPGFVLVLDDSTLAYPEYRGNGVMASLSNITRNGHVGLLFMDFAGSAIGLHVNGTARIIEDTIERPASVLGLRRVDPEGPPGRRPERWVLVNVVEAYIHCGKHIPRLVKLTDDRYQSTDENARKGGDFFGVAAARRASAGFTKKGLGQVDPAATVVADRVAGRGR